VALPRLSRQNASLDRSGMSIAPEASGGAARSSRASRARRPGPDEFGRNQGDKESKMTKVRELMTTPPVTVASTATVEAAARQMRAQDIGALIVEEDGKPYGIVTDRDIVIRGIAEGLNPESAPIASVCSKDLATVSPETDIESAMVLMRDKAVRRLLVVDWENAPLGIVSLGDLAIARDVHSVLGRISAAPPNH
jgi:signal-transduction protein with cAMP-binding, CBS, and nucleotidyltransferase domain